MTLARPLIAAVAAIAVVGGLAVYIHRINRRLGKALDEKAAADATDAVVAGVAAKLELAAHDGLRRLLKYAVTSAKATPRARPPAKNTPNPAAS